MTNALVWLDGKKLYIASLTMIIVPLLIQFGLDQRIGQAIIAVVGILTGTGKYVTENAVDNNTDLGLAVKDKRAKVN